MIKKIFVGLFVSFLCLLGFSNAWEFHRVGQTYTSFVNSNYSVGVLPKGNLLTQMVGPGRNIFYLGGNENNEDVAFFYWTKEKLPYLYVSQYIYGGREVVEGTPLTYKLCDLIDSSTSEPSNCSDVPLSTHFVTNLSGFFNSISFSDYFGYNYFYWDYGTFNFEMCFSSFQYGKSVCFLVGEARYSRTVTTGSLDYGRFGNSIDFFSIGDEVVGTSPGNIGGGGGGSSGGSGVLVGPDISGNDIINYFQNNSVYNFNKSLCYVGIDDLSLNYGSGGSFISGTGKTIFELYDSLYGSVPSLDYVGVWINSRLINYKEWFDNNGNPRFLTTFNSSNGLTSTYFDNLSFPFVNNPTAIYFMATNLYYSSVNSNGNEGYELAVYCDQILNGENAFSIDKSKAYYKNVVSWDYYQNNGKYYFDGSGNLVIRIEPGSGSIANEEFFKQLFGSGGNVEEDFGDYFSIFTTFYNYLDDKFSSLYFSNVVGIVPDYILFVLLLIILFKIFKH